MLGVIDQRTTAPAGEGSEASASQAPQEPRLMVVQRGEQLAGLLVDAVTALLPTRHNTHTRGQLGGRPFHMVTSGQGEQRRSYRVFELTTLPPLQAAPAQQALPD